MSGTQDDDLLKVYKSVIVEKDGKLILCPHLPYSLFYDMEDEEAAKVYEESIGYEMFDDRCKYECYFIEVE